MRILKEKKLFPDLNLCSVAIVGLGYVGLPLAVEIAKKRREIKSNFKKIIGYDINLNRINELKSYIDKSGEIKSQDLKCNDLINYTNDKTDLSNADVFIVTVPTPVNESNLPDLSALKNATKEIGEAIKKRYEKKASTIPLIIYESTVYPGATEEICIPILEKHSGLSFNNYELNSFHIGYSPERINPGDKSKNLINIIKVTSGSSELCANWVNNFYKLFISAGTHLAPSIKVAEAAKIIENTQRDLNIALINELAIICHRLNIDTLDVIDAASTKWNFLKFRPGLVGGHCIGVDPYYLAYKSKKEGYYPEVVLAGRRINERMAEWIVEQVVLQLSKRGQIVGGSKVLILGLTFKENCKDIRNTKVIKMIDSMKTYGIEPIVHDPIADPIEAKNKFNVNLKASLDSLGSYTVVLVAQKHDFYLNFNVNDWANLIVRDGFFFDIKGIVPRSLNPVRI